MKNLYIIRHAKSDWPGNTRDFDRPLSKRGRHDAPKMAALLHAKGIELEKFVSSPALRALTTCKYFAKVYNSRNIETVDKLYMAESEDFTHTILQLDDTYNSVALFSHNNGLTHFVNELAEGSIGHVPTCGIAAFKIKTDFWSDFVNAPKEFSFFYYPKMTGITSRE